MLYLDRHEDAGPQSVADRRDGRRRALQPVSSPPATSASATLDYALSSNSMFDLVERMGEIPVSRTLGKAIRLSQGLRRAEGRLLHSDQRRPRQWPAAGLYPRLSAARRQHPVRRRCTQGIAPRHEKPAEPPDIDLKVVMDQSVYVRASVAALVQEGTIGAMLCSLVILLFLGQWRMTSSPF